MKSENEVWRWQKEGRRKKEEGRREKEAKWNLGHLRLCYRASDNQVSSFQLVRFAAPNTQGLMTRGCSHLSYAESVFFRSGISGVSPHAVWIHDAIMGYSTPVISQTRPDETWIIWGSATEPQIINFHFNSCKNHKVDSPRLWQKKHNFHCDFSGSSPQARRATWKHLLQESHPEPTGNF